MSVNEAMALVLLKVSCRIRMIEVNMEVQLNFHSHFSVDVCELTDDS